MFNDPKYYPRYFECKHKFKYIEINLCALLC
jgi:hypothetical protein